MLRDSAFFRILLYGTERIETGHEGSCGGKPVKEIAERAVSLETKASVKSAVDHLETQGLEAARVTDPEGTLVVKISKDRMIRGVSGRGHDPQTTPLEPEVEKEGEPYCYEHEPIAKAEEVMRQVKADAVSVRKASESQIRDCLAGSRALGLGHPPRNNSLQFLSSEMRLLMSVSGQKIP
jgi:hypothetical protein